jgi:16S rRNA (uracil1498-N3)-methyltransferase
MTSALLQSGGAWLPDMFPDASVERAVSAAPSGTRLVLARDGDPIASVAIGEPVTIALGPEGGMEPDELKTFVDGGFQPVRLSDTTLRFETAGIAAIAIAVAQLALTVSAHGEA